jgi:hypothetical protein
MSARCPVCHATLDVQLEQVPEDGATCRGCGAQVQTFQKDGDDESMPLRRAKKRGLSLKSAYVKQRNADRVS